MKVELIIIGYDGVECFIGSPDTKAYQRFGAHVCSGDLFLWQGQRC